MSTEPSKFPIESAPQKTYTYSLKGLVAKMVAAIVMVLIMSLLIIKELDLLRSWLGLIIPLFLLPLPIFLMVITRRHKNGFITISSKGLTLGGALNIKDGFKSYFSQKDFEKVSHFEWEQIQRLGFTRDLSNPSFLFVELIDGETYYFPLMYFNNKIVIIDNLRRFTGYSGCKDLGRYIPYVKRFRSEDASPHT